jgi:hypothetical protein
MRPTSSHQELLLLKEGASSLPSNLTEPCLICLFHDSKSGESGNAPGGLTALSLVAQ